LEGHKGQNWYLTIKFPHSYCFL